MKTVKPRATAKLWLVHILQLLTIKLCFKWCLGETGRQCGTKGECINYFQYVMLCMETEFSKIWSK